jgi:endonuclease/exonuclease/phosphatase family metal-dependent hydrolase
MKIIAYNIEFAKTTTPTEIAILLKPEGADIICFSEVPNGEWTELVGKELGMNYSYVGKVASANHEEKYPDKTGSFYGKYKSILSRTPLIETDEKLLEGIGWSPVSVVLAKTVINGKQLVIGSLHVPSGVKAPLKSCSADLAELMDGYKDENIIVCGDYNDLTDSEPLQPLYKKGFKNSWMMTDYDWKNEMTCDVKNGEDFGVIDHILYRGKLLITCADIIKSSHPPSDHHAISAEFIVE